MERIQFINSIQKIISIFSFTSRKIFLMQNESACQYTEKSNEKAGLL
jgi:hypothetical protein